MNNNEIRGLIVVVLLGIMILVLAASWYQESINLMECEIQKAVQASNIE